MYLYKYIIKVNIYGIKEKTHKVITLLSDTSSKSLTPEIQYPVKESNLIPYNIYKNNVRAKWGLKKIVPLIVRTHLHSCASMTSAASPSMNSLDP